MTKITAGKPSSSHNSPPTPFRPSLMTQHNSLYFKATTVDMDPILIILMLTTTTFTDNNSKTTKPTLVWSLFQETITTTTRR